VTPTLDLGEQWWHTGGWKADNGTGLDRPFATAAGYQSSPLTLGNKWAMWDAGGSYNNYISDGSCIVPHILTIEQYDTNAMRGTVNGVGFDTFTPYDDSAQTQGLVLFSESKSTYAAGLDGRFYGGAWGQGQVDYDELTTLQDYLGTLLEPDIDPTDVTAYANVYEMLEAQTAAALFDINDKTSLRTIDPVTGSYDVPVEGDAVDLMMDVSGTGGLTMEAYLDGATELVTNGTFDTDSDWTKGLGWTISGGIASSDGVNAGTLQQTISFTAGQWYRCEITISGFSAGALYWRLGNATNIGPMAANGTIVQILQASATGTYFGLFSDPSFDGDIDNISVKALPGYTAVAASDAARPTLKTYNSPISSREILTTTYSWNITDGGRA